MAYFQGFIKIPQSFISSFVMFRKNRSVFLLKEVFLSKNLHMSKFFCIFALDF